MPISPVLRMDRLRSRLEDMLLSGQYSGPAVLHLSQQLDRLILHKMLVARGDFRTLPLRSIRLRIRRGIL